MLSDPLFLHVLNGSADGEPESRDLKSILLLCRVLLIWCRSNLYGQHNLTVTIYERLR